MTAPLPLLQKAPQAAKTTLRFPCFSIALRKKAGQGEVEGELKSHGAGISKKGPGAGISKKGPEAFSQVKGAPRAVISGEEGACPPGWEQCLFCEPRDWERGRMTGKPGPRAAGPGLEKLETREEDSNRL